MDSSVLIIACGALARELTQLIRLNDWQRIQVVCLPASLHNTPDKIPAAVGRMIDGARHDSIFVAFADCGTGGELDRLLAKHSIERLPGAHCYEMFAGNAEFTRLASREPGTFYLTDFLVRNFQRLVHRGLGLDRYPELKATYFANYRKLVYLAQTDDQALRSEAEGCAASLGLDYEYRFTGLGELERSLAVALFQREPTHD